MQKVTKETISPWKILSKETAIFPYKLWKIKKMAKLITNKKVYIHHQISVPSPTHPAPSDGLISISLLDHMCLKDILPVGYSTEDPGALGTA
jgi:hypothetical protein